MNNMESKQTAVEWLVDVLSNYDSKMIELFNKEIEQAKEIEKEQIVIAYDKGFDANSYQPILHYNETYGGNKC